MRRILAIVTGIGVGGVLIAAFEGLNSILFPLPDGVDMSDPEALGRALADAGPQVLGGVALAYFWGAFVGAWLATSIADSEHRHFAGVVTAFFLLGAVFTLFSFPHPAWFWVAGPLAVAVGGHFGWIKGCSTVSARRARRDAAPTPAG